MAMKKMMLSVSDDMLKALEAERRARKLETVPETVRAVLGEYFKRRGVSVRPQSTPCALDTKAGRAISTTSIPKKATFASVAATLTSKWK
jgi:hypothetical protein